MWLTACRICLIADKSGKWGRIKPYLIRHIDPLTTTSTDPPTSFTHGTAYIAERRAGPGRILRLPVLDPKIEHVDEEAEQSLEEGEIPDDAPKTGTTVFTPLARRLPVSQRKTRRRRRGPGDW